MDATRYSAPAHDSTRERRARVTLRALAALAVATLLSATPALAETADEQEASVAVASNIASATAAPARGVVTVIDRDDIALSGVRTVSDLLLSRSTYNSFGLHRPFVLGTGRAAVLINGRRISDSTLDLATLPISAVKRVEILGSAASALHGGHAIAGAVNIVLRRGYEGVEVTASGTRPTDAGGDAEQGSALWGGAVGQGHVTIGVDVFQREEIPDAAREHSRAKWTPGGTFADASGVSVGGNTVTIPTRSHDEDGNVTATHVPGIEGASIARPLGDCPEDTYTGVLIHPRGTGCGFAYADISWGTGRYARYDRESLFLNFDHPLGDGAHTYFDVRLATDELLERFAPSVGTFDVPSAVLEDYLLQDPAIDSLPDTVRVSHRFIGHGNREWRETLEEYDLTLGLEGQLTEDIGYDAHLRYYRHDTVIDGNTFVSESAIQGMIDDGAYDLVNPLAPANRDAIRETALRLTRDQVTDHRTIGASLDGPMFALGGGTARWAAGTEIATEDWRDVYAYRDRSDRSYEAGDVLGSGGSLASGERRRWSGFAEVSLPVRDDWGVTLAGRGDDHDDVGATFSHQAASRFRVNDALTLRGSWDKGSKAPSLYSLHLHESIGYPYVCDTKTLEGPLASCHIDQKEQLSGGNLNLEPDEAESFSVGAAASLGALSLSADWFQIGLTDVPAQLSAQSIIDLEVEGALPPGVAVVRGADGLIERIENRIVNSGETDVSGVDVRARVGWDTAWADLVFDARWLRTTRYEDRVAGEVQPGDYPRDRVHGSLRASRGGITASWNVYAVSSFWNERRTGRFDGWVGHDITIHWREPFGQSGLDLAGGVLNIADRNPSVDPTNPDSAAVTLDSVRGRTFFVNASMAW